MLVHVKSKFGKANAFDFSPLIKLTIFIKINENLVQIAKVDSLFAADSS